jgi:drug/metabolite transporter (DMT)-like permease
MKHYRMWTYLALTGAVVFWGLSFVATKVALESFTVAPLIFTRFFVAACLFLVLMMLKGFPSLTRREHARLFLVALFEPGLYFVFETIGLQHTSAPKASLIIATIPIAVLIPAAIFLGERTTLTKIAGIFLSMVGIALLITGDPAFSWSFGGPMFGDLMIFGAVLSATCYIVCVRSLGQSHSALVITTVQFCYGALMFAPFFLWQLPDIHLALISRRSMAAVAYLICFATIGGFLCYNFALTRLPASRAAVFINAIPVVTAIGAWALLGETLSWIQTIGGLVVLTAVSITNLPSFHKPFRR